MSSTGCACRPSDAKPQANSTENTSTCRISPLANASTADVGTRLTRKSSKPSRLGRARRPGGRCSDGGSMCMPTPGRSTLTMTRPMTSAMRGDHLEVDQGLDRDAADLAEVAHAGDAVGDRAEDDQPDHHLDQVDEDVAEGFSVCPMRVRAPPQRRRGATPARTWRSGPVEAACAARPAARRWMVDVAHRSPVSSLKAPGVGPRSSAPARRGCPGPGRTPRRRRAGAAAVPAPGRCR